MGGRQVAPERLERLAELLDAGLNPLAAARAAGVGTTLAYRVDRERSGAGRRAVQRAAMAVREQERAARARAAPSWSG
jgi:hypothetical protein